MCKCLTRLPLRDEDYNPRKIEDMATEWYVNVAGELSGPFPSSTLTQQLRAGFISRETLIRLGTAGPWIPAGEIADFIGLRERGPDGGLSLPPPKQAAGTTSQAPPS